jgi:CubicO group peptidase (beta-lactamase class C family)
MFRGIIIRLFVASFVTVNAGAGWAGASTSAAQNGKSRAAARDAVAARIDEYLTRSAPFGFSGVVLLARGGEIVLKKGYGYADRGRRVPFTPQTLYNIESVTKQFTASAILKLEEQGRPGTGDPISKYFDGVPESKARITLHQLLTHTAGLQAMNGDDDEKIGRETAVRRILDSKLVSAPGEKWSYSNTGYTLLTVVIEKVSGKPYEAFLGEHLLDPAGMADTGYNDAEGASGPHRPRLQRRQRPGCPARAMGARRALVEPTGRRRPPLHGRGYVPLAPRAQE